MSIDFTKPVQTRDGRKVRILCTDARDEEGKPVHGLYECDGYEVYGGWTSAGRWSRAEERSMDLINVPPPKKKVTVEVRLYSVGGELRAWARADVDGDRWHPSLDGRPFVGSLATEMEYQP